MSNIKLGDKVAAYFCMGSRRVGVVLESIENILLIKGEEKEPFQAHVKQCRKLVKRKKERLGPVEEMKEYDREMDKCFIIKFRRILE